MVKNVAVWTDNDNPPGIDYFTVWGATSVRPVYTNTGSGKNLMYSKDGGPWNSVIYNPNPSTITGITSNIRFRGTGMNSLYTGSATTNRWVFTGDNISFSGNINTLLRYENLDTIVYGSYTFTCMFYGCTNITSPPGLPATILSPYCYSNMFYGCTSLTDAPSLPAETLVSNCYNYMFYNCTSLVNAPELPSEILPTSCYSDMFRGCTNLVSAPGSDVYTTKSPSQTRMFNGCTKLTTPLTFTQIPTGWK
jgi:hypothetical protein